MANEWYYDIEGVRKGPISNEQLKQLADAKTIDRDNLVWRDGMVEWSQAGSIKGLFSYPPTSLPAVATQTNDTQEQLKCYKILSQKDKWFSGKFDPVALEQALNSYAEQGWILRAAVTASIPGFGGAREEMVMILERNKP